MIRLVRIAAFVCLAGTLALMVLTGSTLQRKSRTIMANAESGGTIFPTGTVLVSDGSNQSFTIATTSGEFHISRVLVDGVSVGAVTSYTFTKVKADHTIEVSFAGGSGGGPVRMPE